MDAIYCPRCASTHYASGTTTAGTTTVNSIIIDLAPRKIIQENSMEWQIFMPALRQYML
jgi:hypothetical protein